MKRSALLLCGLVLAGSVVVLAGGVGTGPRPARATGLDLTTLQNRILSGFASFEFNHGLGANAARTQTSPRGSFRPTGDDGCRASIGGNVKVNQNCLNITDSDLQGRGQAQNETAIAQDPNHPDRMIATYNDYRRGDGTCGVSYSRGGLQWQDATLPNGFVRGDSFGAARQYFQAGGDPSVAWDSKDNAYYDCQMFQRGEPTTNNPDNSSGIYLFRSTGNSGASWNFTGRPVVEQPTSDPSGLPLLDKPYMTADSHKGSPFQDRIYVTWTKFDLDGSARIFEAYSSDYGETFSSPVLVSGDSSLCPNGFTASNSCDVNQDSQPFTGPDGVLYVLFSNFNNSLSSATDNHNQILIAKSTDGGASFGSPVKVSDFYDMPDCATYQDGQDFGRACMPEKGASTDSVFRASNYASAGVNPKNANQIVVTFGSYISKTSRESNGCVPQGFDPSTGADLYTGVKTPGACNNKILVSTSTDGGGSFTGTSTDPRSLPIVNQDRGQASSDQFWQWAAFSAGGKLAVSYYDRQYGNDETTGASDISVSGSSNMTSFRTRRATSSSMPAPTEFPDAEGNSLFWGDYSGLTAQTDAQPLWMDSRSPDLFLCPGTAAPGVPPQVCTATEPNGLAANDEDVFTARVAIP
ncbi:MAG: exo-alpha-sialidase [Gaiellaceae bacterium]